jgi:hypothetical protein
MHKLHVTNCGNLPQSDRQPNSFLRSQSYRQPDSFGGTVIQTARLLRSQSNRHRVVSAGSIYTLQLAAGRLHTNTGASQPAPTTSALPPTGPHSAQRQRDKNAGLQQATSPSSSSISTINTSNSALGESSSGQQPHLRGQQLYTP